MRGLYVHIPFCEYKCHYCDFVISTQRAQQDRAQFLEALTAEVEHWRLEYGCISFDTLYFGGGTPSQLAPHELQHIWELLHATFEIAPDAEISFEANPSDITPAYAEFCQSLGINRFSLGAQSFQQKLLEDMGRQHSAEDSIRAVQILQAAGFDNISMDLILRLPGQSLSMLESDLQQLVALNIQQVVTYDLSVHANTVYGQRAAQGRLYLPEEALHAEMFDLVERVLAGSGFEHYEIATFAKLGFQSKHNLIYWRNQEYLGLGPGAFSYLGHHRFQLAEHFASYLCKCLQQNWCLSQSDKMCVETREKEGLITNIRLKEGIFVGDFPHIEAEILPKIGKLCDMGLLEANKGRFRLTKKGCRVPETVFSMLL